MGQQQSVSRANISFLGIDVLTIRQPDNVTRALATGDLVRMTDVFNSLEDLPWFLRWFFPLTRFYSTVHGFFMPFRSRSDSTYMPCHDFLHTKLDAPIDLSNEVRAAAQLIVDPSRLPDDKELGAAFTRGITARFVPEVPQHVLESAMKQVTELSQAFLPWHFLGARAAVDTVYDFFAQKAADDPATPPGCVTDLSQSVLSGMNLGPVLLRALAAHIEADVADLLATLGPTESVMRIPQRETTLGGLVPNGETISRNTLVLLNIRDGAQATGDISWVFGTGTASGRCCAANAIIAFLRDVQTETLRIRRERNNESKE